MSNADTFTSCRFLRGSIVFQDDSIAHCCATGRRTVSIPGGYQGKAVPENAIRRYRRTMEQNLSAGKECVCSGCGYLECKNWDEGYFCDDLNIGHSVICNLRCIYCGCDPKTRKDAGEPYYAFLPVLRDLYDRELLSPTAYIGFAAGEPFLLPDFEDLLATVMERSSSTATIMSNLTMYSEMVERMLQEKRGKLVVSVDSGLRETFHRIKGRDLHDKVWGNLKRYGSISPECIMLKYICVSGNMDLDNMHSFFVNADRCGIHQIRLGSDFFGRIDLQLVEFMAEFQYEALRRGFCLTINTGEEEMNHPGIRVTGRIAHAYRKRIKEEWHRKNPSIEKGAAAGMLDGVIGDHPGGGLCLWGWAYLRDTGEKGKTAGNIVISWKNEPILAGACNDSRGDVSKTERAGFVFYLPDADLMREILADKDQLTAYAEFHDGKWYELGRSF